MSPFANRNILFLDTKRDQTRVANRIESLGLNTHVVHDMSSVSDRESCPHIDTIVVDSPEWVGVSGVVCFLIVCVDQQLLPPDREDSRVRTSQIYSDRSPGSRECIGPRPNFHD